MSKEQGETPHFSNLYQSTRAGGNQQQDRHFQDDKDDMLHDRELAAKLAINANGGGPAGQSEERTTDYAATRGADEYRHDMSRGRGLAVATSRKAKDQPRSNNVELNEWPDQTSKSSDNAFQAFQRDEAVNMQGHSGTEKVWASNQAYPGNQDLQLDEEDVETEEYCDDWIGMKKTVAHPTEEYAGNEAARTESRIEADRMLAEWARQDKQDFKSDEQDLERGRIPIHAIHRHSKPGAVRVGGGEYESFDSAGVDPAIPSPEITAELVDMDMEAQRLREQVQLGIEKERTMAPIAQVVQEPFWDRRKTIIALLLAFLAVLGIVLGVTLAPEKGPPPAPVPSRDEIVEVVSGLSSDGGESLQRPGTPQNKALDWITNDLFQGYRTDEKLIQRYALATLFYSTNGETWFNNTMWLDGNDECDWWFQVLCDSETGHASSLALGSNNLTGPIPPEIGLIDLVDVDLSGNHLKGSIPTSLENWTSLESLNIMESLLSGSIPERFANITSLKSLNLAENELTGTFMANVGKLTNLEDLALFANKLSGQLPNDIFQLSYLKNINLRDNLLEGTIPTGFGALTLLTELSLYSNSLSGPIPSEIGNMKALNSINLRSSQLTGTIPTDIGRLSLLKSLSLRTNKLNGTIPQIDKLTNLESISLRENELTGKIPPEISRFTLLTELALHQNVLTGPIPQLSELTLLTSLNVYSNKLTGTIPSMERLTLLEDLHLRQNELTGVLPDFGALSSLKSVNVRDNNLGGTLTTNIGVLSSTLESLHLEENLLNGTLPTEVGLLTMLTSLNVRDNNLSGDIPSEIYRLTGHLSDINLGNSGAFRGNSFRGSLLEDIQLMTNLEKIGLYNIQLYGTIPTGIGRLTKLLQLELHGNQLTGTIPPVFDDMRDLSMLTLHSNNFTGSFTCPAHVEKCLVSCEFLIDSCRSI